MKTSVKVSLGGIIGALSIVLMSLTSIIPFGTFAFPTFAGMLLVAIVIEHGKAWAFSIYFVVSVLSFLLLADKEAALYYVAFLGFYPIVKAIIERIKSKVLQYVVKFILFNICMVIAFYLSVFVLSIPKESFTIAGHYMPLAFLAIGNVAFIVYDFCVSKIVAIYMLKIHNLLAKKTKL